MPQNRFELVIFDCDGVLVDSEPLAALAYHNIYAQQGLALPDGTIAQCIGLKQADIIARIAELTGLELADGAETGLWPETKRVFADSLQPTPGIASLLEKLETPHCVASGSSLERIQFSLEITGLARYFGDAIFSSFMVKRGKPAPDLFFHAAAQMQTDPAKCVVIEDSPFGIEGAVAAGMTALGYTGGTHTHDDHAPALLAKGAAAVFSDWSNLSQWIASR
ncbi:MAG: HAD family phosphatase [Phyllobacterium sp.]|uniref:HAD family hydrolase n=1 Tax=Phyllobacterium sp. TaxID=1871046 RepID=UPI0030F172C5